MPISKSVKAPKTPKDVMPEHAHQAAVFAWAAMSARHRPALKLLVAIPNGGLRSKAAAGKLKAEGVKAGYPDIALNVARGGYHGLFIELKTKTGSVSLEQKQWLLDLRAQGNYAEVCRGWLAAKTLIENYLDERLDA